MNPGCDNSDRKLPGFGIGRAPSGTGSPAPRPVPGISPDSAAPTSGFPDPLFEPSKDWLDKVAQGDRDAAAQFIARCGPLIRRRVRGKLRASMRRLYDSEDILSTVGRRLDAYVNARKFEARSSDEFWGLVLKIAQNSIIEKARTVKGLEAKEGEDSPLAHAILRRMRDAERMNPAASDLVVDELLDMVTDETDREILTLWLLDTPQQQIALATNISYDALRKRWQRIRESLRKSIEGNAE